MDSFAGLESVCRCKCKAGLMGPRSLDCGIQSYCRLAAVRNERNWKWGYRNLVHIFHTCKYALTANVCLYQ